MNTKRSAKGDCAYSLSNLTKGSVWDLQENDIIRLWQAAAKDQDIEECAPHYMDIIRTAFEMEELRVDKPEIIKKYEARGMRVAALPIGEGTKKWGIRKRPIARVTDLTYENIRHISASKLLEVIDRNFGGGWESLSQSIRDIIMSGFDISTTTLPKDRLKKPGGMYQIKLADGFVALEVAKGLWVEAIFAKAKPMVEKPTTSDDTPLHHDENDEDGDEDEEKEDYDKEDEDSFDKEEEELDDDVLTEESYRTTIDETPEDLDVTVDDLDDEEY